MAYGGVGGLARVPQIYVIEGNRRKPLEIFGFLLLTVGAGCG